MLRWERRVNKYGKNSIYFFCLHPPLRIEQIFVSRMHTVLIMIGEELIHYAALCFGWIGAFITIYGSILAAIRIFLKEAAKKAITYNDIRLDFTNKIIFGLDFFIVADILTLFISPTIDELTVLGVVVIIRTILGYFLEKEAEEFKVE